MKTTHYPELFRLQGLDYYYQDSPALLDFNLVLEQGKFYGLLGPNGSGKTTFLDVLSAHKSPNRGKIFFQGQEMGKYSKKMLAKQIALVPQDYYLNFPFTVRDVVLMGRYPHISRFRTPGREDWQIVTQAMQETGIWPFQGRLITELSGGERQRVVFARALAQNTGVLLLDEATSSLDIKFALNLLHLARQRNLTQGMTILAVFHHLNQAACFCDELLFFQQGRLVEKGPTREVLTPEILEKVFEVKAKVYYEPFINCLQAVFKPENPEEGMLHEL